MVAVHIKNILNNSFNLGFSYRNRTADVGFVLTNGDWEEYSFWKVSSTIILESINYCN